MEYAPPVAEALPGEVSTGIAPSAASLGIRRIHLTLIRPTNYTDDGYPITMRLGVIRSNTLTQMGTLSRDLSSYPFFQGVTVSVDLVDEAIQRVRVRDIVRESEVSGTRSIVMIVGVQSSQFPRAQDIASWFLPHRIPVLIGGFHVSGMYSMVGLTSDLRDAMSRGMILVAGEVEGDRLPAIVRDVLLGTHQPFYNYLTPTPDLSDLPIPRLTKEDFKGFASSYSTIDTGRGCVFTCDFCTIINVQGRTMRCRDPKQVVEFVRQSYKDSGVAHAFFTDDNIARNPRWRELFLGLASLREDEHIPFTFMMQSDLAARKMQGGDFFTLASRAGCNQVFFGVESVNRENLRSQGKYQNQVAGYKDLVDHLHGLAMAAHAGYILGLPFDTAASISDDVKELKRIGFDSTSFYILTPLPGSKDHQRWWRERRWMDADFNTYDSAHVAVEPERMTRAELVAAYNRAWDEFYTPDHMVNILNMWKPHGRSSYWGRLFFFAAYLYAARIERLHPMNCGFWTIRRRADRRPTFKRDNVIRFWWKQCRTMLHRFYGLFKLFLELEEVWMRTRPKSKDEEALLALAASTKKEMCDWRDLKLSELVALYEKIHIEMPEIQVPSKIGLWFKKRNPFASTYTRTYALRCWKRWYVHVWNPFKWAELWLFEGVNGVRFLSHLLVEGRN